MAQALLRMVFNCAAKRWVNAIDSRLRARSPIFRGVRRPEEIILNKLHLNQDIADFWCMMP
ncbi:hypothetical protein ACI77I_31660, partial [Pseudomonas sp. D47]|uniref:hypothetical protein n=1 Tax=Pseudomonas sp. D47 TaxID=3159447 RepID=UPI00387B441B